MIGVWMTPCKNGQCELSVRRDGINKIVIATQTPLTDAQAEELFWCIGAMRRSGKTLKDLLKEQERKKGSWDYGTQCSACKGTIIPPKDRKVRVNFCPWCGADMRDSYEQEGR